MPALRNVRMRGEWVAETADGQPSAHFEHTVAITANGPLDSDAPERDDAAVLVRGLREVAASCRV